MALKKRDFQKIAQQVQEFLVKLSCEEGTADLRDALNLALFYTQRYYKTLRTRSHSNKVSSGSEHRSLSGTLLFTNSCGAVSPVSPACGMQNQFEWKWYNLESPKLSASLGTSEFCSISPFLQAAKTGDIEVLKALINEDPEAVNNSLDGLGRNGLMYSVHGNTPAHIECLELILERTQLDPDHQANDYSTALHVATHENNTTALKLLLRNKASCSIEDNEGRTALHWAAANPSVDNLKLLLQHGANIRVSDCEGLTPAMWACHFDQLKNLTVLQSALSRVDPCDDALYEETDLKGRTVMHWAVNKTGSTECLKALLTKESGILYDNEKKNILHTAAEQGVLPACQLVLDVCGDECLSMTDSKGRTPLHLAALCGHAEILMFLLERGADLSARDNNGLTPVNIIENKHLYYCMMVLSLNPQYQKLYSDQNNNTSITSPHLDTSDETSRSNRKISPSAPPAFEVIGDESHTEARENNRSGDEDNAIFYNVGSSNRRKSEVTSTQLEPPKPQPRRSRKQSAPAKLGHKNYEKDEEELKQKREIQSPECSSGSDSKEKQAPVRRQSLLMRQEGIQEEPVQQDLLRAASFDLHTEDGTVVLIGDIDDLQANTDALDLNDDVLEIDCGDKHEEEENFGYSSSHLAEGRGSASSAKSELDHADNCSVSVEMSVSSIGSDNDNGLFNDTGDMHEEVLDDRDYGQPTPSPERKVNVIAKGTGQLVYPTPPPNEPSVQQPPHPPKSPRQIHHESQHQGTSSQAELISETTEKKTKKKKDKKKKKDSLHQESPVTPPLGVIAPLEPPSMSPLGPGPGPSKLGGMNGIVTKPGPWEHASLGLLRRGSSESPRLGPQPPYRSSEEFEMYSERGGLDRPRTPEPPWNSSRDVMTKPLCHPTPPGGRVQGEERDLYGAASGYVNQNQTLLRNTEMMIRGPNTGKNVGTMGNTMPRSKSPQMTAFSLHGGPMPHPPQR